MSRTNLKNSLAVVLLFVVSPWACQSAYTQPWDGNGVEGDPYQIWTAADMQAIGADSNYWDAHFKLMADIDLGGCTGMSFNIIGTYPHSPTGGTAFTGVFDGNGYTISNFTYLSTEKYFIGIFGYVDDPNAELKDLGLVEPCVVGFRTVGSLVGNIERGGVSRCFATGGSISGTHVTGGLVGASWFGEVVESYSTSNVVGEYEVGGLVGYVEWGSVTDCYSCGSVSGFRTVGGLLGENNYGIVVNCYARGEVSGETGVGGLIGRREFAVIEHSFWDVNSSGQASSDGGTGKTTVEMQDPNTFLDAGWDFIGEANNGVDDIWTLCESPDYPRFWWECPHPVEAEVQIRPKTLNLQSKGKWISCRISLPDGYNVADIDPNSILLEEEIAPDSVVLYGRLAVAKFNRAAVQELLSELQTPGEAELLVSGQLNDGTIFEGTDIIRIVGPKRKLTLRRRVGR